MNDSTAARPNDVNPAPKSPRILTFVENTYSHTTPMDCPEWDDTVFASDCVTTYP